MSSSLSNQKENGACLHPSKTGQHQACQRPHQWELQVQIKPQDDREAGTSTFTCLVAGPPSNFRYTSEFNWLTPYFSPWNNLLAMLFVCCNFSSFFWWLIFPFPSLLFMICSFTQGNSKRCRFYLLSSDSM